MGSVMTDHKLCMAAAKAVGYTVKNRGTWISSTVKGLTMPWWPVGNDCDAFRLMVDCGIDVSTSAGSASAVLHRGDGSVEWFFVEFGTDKHAATRRAIVRAAAAMGDDK